MPTSPKSSSGPNETERSISISSQLIWALAGIIVSMAGASMGLNAALRPILLAQNARAWVATPGTVTISKMVEDDIGDDSNDMKHEMSYAYVVNGQRYVSNRLDISRIHASQEAEDVQKQIEAHPVGSPITCYVNPADPSQATIGREVGWPEIIVGTLSVAIIIGGFVLAWITFRRYMQWNRARRTSATSGHIPFEPGTDVLIFKCAPRRVISAIVMSAAAIVWLSVTAFMIVSVFREPFSLAYAIAYMFVAVFVWGGVLVLGLACSYLLRLINPLPHFALSPGLLRPGEPFELIWSISSTRIHRLEIRLEAVWGSYSDQNYEQNVITGIERSKFPLVDTSDPSKIAAGRFTMILPKDVPPTNPDSNPEVVWKFKIQGHIPLWPDITDEHRVLVMPAKQVGTTSAVNVLDQ